MKKPRRKERGVGRSLKDAGGVHAPIRAPAGRVEHGLSRFVALWHREPFGFKALDRVDVGRGAILTREVKPDSFHVGDRLLDNSHHMIDISEIPGIGCFSVAVGEGADSDAFGDDSIVRIDVLRRDSCRVDDQMLILAV
jgi:hypothetical protein